MDMNRITSNYVDIFNRHHTRNNIFRQIIKIIQQTQGKKDQELIRAIRAVLNQRYPRDRYQSPSICHQIVCGQFEHMFRSAIKTYHT